MSKIKKFRLQVRPAAVVRGLRSLVAGAQDTPELEKAVETEIRRASDLYATAALYETFDPGQTPAWASSLWDFSDDNGAKPVALSFFTATIGSSLEGELGEALSRGEGLRGQILTAVGEESAGQAAQFVHRVLSEEAVKESCELSPPQDASAPDVRQGILSLLGADKIQVQADAEGRQSPRFTRTGYVAWWPPAKKKK